jgi:hypothetical protein
MHKLKYTASCMVVENKSLYTGGNYWQARKPDIKHAKKLIKANTGKDIPIHLTGRMAKHSVCL